MNKFIYDKKNFKKKLQQALPVIGIVAIVVAILSILILPSRLETIRKCDELGLGGDFGTIVTGQCTKSFDEIIFVVGDTQNTPAPSLNYPEYIDTALNIKKASISAISVSNSHRNPKIITDYDESNKANKIISKVDEFLSTTAAVNNGADYLEAIQTAAEYAENKNRTLIYVIGSGLSDHGTLNFADNSFLDKNSNTEEISEKVSQYIDNPSILKDTTIVWDGIGQTISPQPALNDSNRVKLKEIYGLIFKELGNRTVRFKDKLSSDSSANTLNTVKITKITQEGPCFSETYTANKTSAFKFNGDSATLVDSGATDEEVDKVVAATNGCPNAKVKVTAYMSRGQCSRQDVDNALLDDRLNAIKNKLIERGINPEKIELVPGGFGDAPECNNGDYNSAEGEKNRRVDIEVKSE